MSSIIGKSTVKLEWVSDEDVSKRLSMKNLERKHYFLVYLIYKKMVKFYGPKRRRKFNEDADWRPPKNRPLVLKQPKAEAEPKSESSPEGAQAKGPNQKPKQAPKDTTDKEGLDQACFGLRSLQRCPRNASRGGQARRLSRIRLDGELQSLRSRAG